MEMSPAPPELIAPPSFKPSPLPYGFEGLRSWEALASVLLVADVITAFAKPLGLKATTALDVTHLITAVTSSSSSEEGGEVEGAGSSSRAEACTALAALYRSLITAVLQDAEESGTAPRVEERWEAVLEVTGGGDGVWPEVLRRLMLSRVASEWQDDGVPLVADSAYHHSVSCN
jgi:hypothetical protein